MIDGSMSGCECLPAFKIDERGVLLPGCVHEEQVHEYCCLLSAPIAHAVILKIDVDLDFLDHC